MLALCVLLGLVYVPMSSAVSAATPESNYRGQFCTDPRTMRKHPAYTEWADAYSCSRHRCQPGGRNLAIYTVGCKRVEAPESAIECEEVVEDTNMQFPYCCTRLRCLVVVRGEVWTRVLGQPWEALPAAPWSHMYKMKKPPPGEGAFLPKQGEGPVYELLAESDNDQEKQMRAKKSNSDPKDCEPVARARANNHPDIVIALSTNVAKDPPPYKSDKSMRNKRGRKSSNPAREVYERLQSRQSELYHDAEDTVTEKEKSPEAEPISDERERDGRYFGNHYEVTQKPSTKTQHPWSIPDLPSDGDQPSRADQPRVQEPINDYDGQPEQRVNYQSADYLPIEERQTKKPEKPQKAGALHALVDAIGNRMRDIETVVNRMSDTVDTVADPAYTSAEKLTEQKLYEPNERERVKKPNPEGDYYKRFVTRDNGGSKYLHGAVDYTTEAPLFVEDGNTNGYYSDGRVASSVRRGPPPREPVMTYMAPVDNRRKSHSDESGEKKRKKKLHKKKHTKGHHKKHHIKGDRKKRINRVNSLEVEKNNVVSVEDLGDT